MRISLEYGFWEEQYLLNDIFPSGEISYIDPLNLEDYNIPSDVFIFCSRTHSYSEVLKVVQRIKPKVIVCMSDELLFEDLSCFNELGNYCKLFLRQHHHLDYTYTENTIPIPLGYTNGCKVFNQPKQLNWSFFGDLKSNRKEMIDEFYTLEPYFVGNKASKEIMCKIYSKSIFVPCGRGNSSLNCFRMYEASMNGAIPVVAASKEEIEWTFKYEENPPWIFAETWKEAVEKCKSMLECGISNQSVLNWWNDRISKIKTKVLEVL